MHYPGHAGSGMTRICTQIVLFQFPWENPPKCKADRGFHHWCSLGQWCQFRSDWKSCLQLDLNYLFKHLLPAPGANPHACILYRRGVGPPWTGCALFCFYTSACRVLYVFNPIPALATWNLFTHYSRPHPWRLSWHPTQAELIISPDVG